MESSDLETLFIGAFTNPGLRPSFYRLLMHSDLWVLTADQPGTPSPSIVSFIRDDGAQVVPCFTSEGALGLNEPVPLSGYAPPRAVRIPSRTLMQMTQGLYLHLNPRSDFSRDFTPEEIGWLLKDEAIHYGTRRPEVAPAGTDIQLRKLAVSQPELEAALIEVFRRAPEVGCAFLVEAERVRGGELVRTMMMVAEAKPSAVLTNAVSTIFSDVYDFSLPVDLCFDEGDKDFVSTLLRVGAKPFFVGARKQLPTA
jgi:SseB protein N-terminal domain